MEYNKNKLTFEPVSAEEARKIRAFREDISPQSGTVDCGSGFHDAYAACATKNDGEACCVSLANGKNVVGYCAKNVSGTEDGSLKCITNPTEVPDKPIKPEP